MDSLRRATGADIRVGGREAHYERDGDYIRLPTRELFLDPRDLGDWGRLCLHELGHYALSPRRLNISLPGVSSFHRYGYSEIIAELAGEFCANALGVPASNEPAEYLGHWLHELRASPELIWTLAPTSERVSAHILSFDPGSSAIPHPPHSLKGD